MSSKGSDSHGISRDKLNGLSSEELVRLLMQKTDDLVNSSNSKNPDQSLVESLHKDIKMIHELIREKRNSEREV